MWLSFDVEGRRSVVCRAKDADMFDHGTSSKLLLRPWKGDILPEIGAFESPL